MNTVRINFVKFFTTWPWCLGHSLTSDMNLPPLPPPSDEKRKKLKAMSAKKRKEETGDMRIQMKKEEDERMSVIYREAMEKYSIFVTSPKGKEKQLKINATFDKWLLFYLVFGVILGYGLFSIGLYQTVTIQPILIPRQRAQCTVTKSEVINYYNTSSTSSPNYYNSSVPTAPSFLSTYNYGDIIIRKFTGESLPQSRSDKSWRTSDTKYCDAGGLYGTNCRNDFLRHPCSVTVATYCDNNVLDSCQHISASDAAFPVPSINTPVTMFLSSNMLSMTTIGEEDDQIDLATANYSNSYYNDIDSFTVECLMFDVKALNASNLYPNKNQSVVYNNDLGYEDRIYALGYDMTGYTLLLVLGSIFGVLASGIFILIPVLNSCEKYHRGQQTANKLKIMDSICCSNPVARVFIVLLSPLFVGVGLTCILAGCSLAITYPLVVIAAVLDGNEPPTPSDIAAGMVLGFVLCWYPLQAFKALITCSHPCSCCRNGCGPPDIKKQEKGTTSSNVEISVVGDDAPRCALNHTMVLIPIDSPFPYEGRGFRCDLCRGSSNGSTERWFCKECSSDFCFQCHPKNTEVPSSLPSSIAVASRHRSTSV